MISIPLDHEIFAPCFMSLDMFQCLLVYSLWELEQNLYPTVVWKLHNLNDVELVHGAFQVYYILLLFCLFILLTFESLILKLQLKILIYLLKNNCNIVELYVTLFCTFQVSYKCVVILFNERKSWCPTQSKLNI